jgi:hypothetical protein
MPISAGISAGGSLLGGLFGSKGASAAAKEQEQAQQKVINETGTAVQNAQQGIATGISGVTGATTGGQNLIAGGTTAATGALSPYATAGTGALNSLQQLATGTALNTPFSFTQQDLTNNPANPGYQFTLSQGEQAIQKAAAAQGGLFSTGTAKSLAGYAEGTANQYEQTAYNQALQNFQTNQQQALSRGNILSALLGTGATATGQTASLLQQGSQAGANLGLAGATTGLQGQEASGQVGLTGAQIIGQALTGQGNAAAAGTVGSTNSWLNALQGGTNAITGYLTNNSLYGTNNLGQLGTGTVPSSAPIGGILPPSSPTPVAGPTNPYTGQPL